MKVPCPRSKKRLLLMINPFFWGNALQHLAEILRIIQSVSAIPIGFDTATKKKPFGQGQFMTLMHTGNKTNRIENRTIILTCTLTHMLPRIHLQHYECRWFLRGKEKYCKLEFFILYFLIKLFEWLKDLAKTEKNIVNYCSFSKKIEKSLT